MVPEFLQGAGEATRLGRAAVQIWRKPKGAGGMRGRSREVAKKGGAAGAAARAAQEVEEAIRARQKSVIAAKESVGDGEKGGGGGAQGA